MALAPVDDSIGVIVIADTVEAAAAANAAVAMAGSRLLTTIPWLGASERVAQQVGPVVVLAEVAGASEDTISAILSDLATRIETRHLILAFDTGWLDQVAGLLIGSDATLLCDPLLADRVAALIAAQTVLPPIVQDSSEEAARLARINAEVARFTETLTRLTGPQQRQDTAEERSPIVGDRRYDFGQPPGDASVSATELRRTIRARRLRSEVFGVPGLFEDPGWDMLLDLFAADLERRSVSVSSLCIAAGVAPTTALRWINKLIAVGLFERRPDSFDRRRAYIALTPRAVSGLQDYVAAVRRAGLSIA